jgi:hypothetical protein
MYWSNVVNTFTLYYQNTVCSDDEWNVKSFNLSCPVIIYERTNKQTHRRPQIYFQTILYCTKRATCFDFSTNFFSLTFLCLGVVMAFFKKNPKHITGFGLFKDVGWKILTVWLFLQVCQLLENIAIMSALQWRYICRHVSIIPAAHRFGAAVTIYDSVIKPDHHLKSCISTLEGRDNCRCNTFCRPGI